MKIQRGSWYLNSILLGAGSVGVGRGWPDRGSEEIGYLVAVWITRTRTWPHERMLAGTQMNRVSIKCHAIYSPNLISLYCQGLSALCWLVLSGRKVYFGDRRFPISFHTWWWGRMNLSCTLWRLPPTKVNSCNVSNTNRLLLATIRLAPTIYHNQT